MEAVQTYRTGLKSMGIPFKTDLKPPLRNNITPEIISYLDRDFFSSENMLCQLDHGIVAFTNGLFEVIKASHLVLGDSHSTLKMKKHSLIKKSINEQDMMMMIFNIFCFQRKNTFDSELLSYQV